MNKYDVYGLGNALLDVEVEVTDQQLKALGIKKGVMTLISQEEHQKLTDYFAGNKRLMACGGSAANTMIALAQLGGRGFYSAKVSADESGQHFLSDLVKQGLSTNLKLDSLAEGITGHCLALVTPDAERTMNTYLGITESFSVAELDLDALRQSDYLYVEGYLVTSPTAREAAIKARHIAKEADVKTSITLSDPNMTEFFADGLLEMIGDGVDLLFCNEAEAKIFAATSSLNEACQYLATLAKQFAVTLGKRGALVYDGQSYYEAKGVETDVVDTLGAGDMFAGAFLRSISSGSNPFEAASRANIAASKIIAKFGPRLNDNEVNILSSDLEQFTGGMVA